MALKNQTSKTVGLKRTHSSASTVKTQKKQKQSPPKLKKLLSSPIKVAVGSKKEEPAKSIANSPSKSTQNTQVRENQSRTKFYEQQLSQPQLNAKFEKELKRVYAEIDKYSQLSWAQKSMHELYWSNGK